MVTEPVNGFIKIVCYRLLSSSSEVLRLRDSAFILSAKGWRLSPAFDLNPSVDKDGLELNIDTHNNALDFDLAKEVGEYFQLKEKQMDEIIDEVLHVTSTWKEKAASIGISRSEQERMARAFRVKR